MLLRRHREAKLQTPDAAEPEVVDQVTDPGSVDLEAMTVDELKAYAEEKGIDLGRSTSHDGILKKIQEAEAQSETEE